MRQEEEEEVVGREGAQSAVLKSNAAIEFGTRMEKLSNVLDGKKGSMKSSRRAPGEGDGRPLETE